jgi:hypothetical protein
MANPPAGSRFFGAPGYQTAYDPANNRWQQQGGQWVLVEAGPTATTSTVPTTQDLTEENKTSAAKAAQLLYNALRGMPYVSAEFLNALSQGKLPAPRTLTPQTLKLLNDDTTLSDTFFSLVKAGSVYPDSYLAEIGRFMPKGMDATPSFI